MTSDSKVFRYRFDFPPKSLLEFIRERYYQNSNESGLDDRILDRVKLNGEEVTDKTIVNTGDWIEYLHYREDEERSETPLKVIYEDEWMVAISKPDNLPVTPSTSYYFNSLAILAKEFFDNNDISPVHRLDFETSGVLLFGKGKKARGLIQKLFQEHKIKKIYQAILFNRPVVSSISGNLVPDRQSKIYTKLILEPSPLANSLTLIEKQEPWGGYTRVWARPVTGKTNQIRAHFSAINCPIVGDKKYYPDEEVFLNWFAHRDIDLLLPKLKLERHALHCESMTFKSPFDDHTIRLVDHSVTWREKIDKLL